MGSSLATNSVILSFNSVMIVMMWTAGAASACWFCSGTFSSSTALLSSSLTSSTLTSSSYCFYSSTTGWASPSTGATTYSATAYSSTLAESSTMAGTSSFWSVFLVSFLSAFFSFGALGALGAFLAPFFASISYFLAISASASSLRISPTALELLLNSE